MRTKDECLLLISATGDFLMKHDESTDVRDATVPATLCSPHPKDLGKLERAYCDKVRTVVSGISYFGFHLSVVEDCVWWVVAVTNGGSEGGGMDGATPEQ